MTITEHLAFSVVSAPLAQIDRRALSQAWYSALCKSEAKAEPAAHAAKQSPRTASVSRRRDTGTANARTTEAHRVERNAAHRTDERPKRSGVGDDRRAARSPLARRIERRFLNPAQRPQQAAFALDGDAGRVQVLLQGSGSQMQLVAICAPPACAAVTAALAQARYALAVRGILLRTETRAARA